MFDNERALYAINFIQNLKLSTGKFAGKSLELMPWQHEFLSSVYGTLGSDGMRRYNTAYLEVPKKSGKSTLGAGIAIYHTFADGERRGEIYGCAADRAQASLVFDIAVDMVDQSPALKKRAKLTLSQKMLEDKETGSKYKVLSSEAYTKHGLNVSCCIFDELHAQPNSDLWEVMTTGSGDAREEPLWYVITTAGNDPDRKSIGWTVHEKAQKILDGEIIDPHWYCKIYGLPEEEDPWDEDNWYKVNPSLGHTISIEKIRQAALSARNSEAEERLFRWLRLNQWISLKRIGWLPLTLWDTTEGKWNPAELIGKRCYAGLDLSSTTDLTALKLLFPPQDGFDDWREISEAWIPEDSMKERVARDGVPYDRWVKSKHLHVTPGNAVAYEFVEARILAANQQYKIEMLGTDPWNSRMLTQRLEKGGVKLYEVPQNMANMSPAMKEQERLMRTGNYTHEYNPAARWCFGNTNIAVDGNGNIKPMKNKSVERIDIAVAGIIAMAVAIQMGAMVQGCYERRGMRSLL